MNRVEKERKQAILDRMMEERGSSKPVERVSHLDRLFTAYAQGENHRQEIASNIVARFRPFLRKGDTGPNYDGPLYAEIEQALRAAEEYGRCEAQLAAAARSGQGMVSGQGQVGKRAVEALFSADEVQRCLFCGMEYRPAVETHICAAL